MSEINMKLPRLLICRVLFGRVPQERHIGTSGERETVGSLCVPEKSQLHSDTPAKNLSRGEVGHMIE